MAFTLISGLLSEDRKKNKTYTEKFDKKVATKLLEVSTEAKPESVGRTKMGYCSKAVS